MPLFIAAHTSKSRRSRQNSGQKSSSGVNVIHKFHILWGRLPDLAKLCILYFSMGMLAATGAFLFKWSEYDEMEKNITAYNHLRDQRDAMFTTEQLEILEEWDKISHNYSDNNMWTLRYAVFFATTIFTTIGFGFQYPKTPGGYALCIIYGIPSIMIYGYLAQLIGGIWIKSIDDIFQHRLKIPKKVWNKYYILIYFTILLSICSVIVYIIQITAQEDGFGTGIHNFWTALYFIWSATSTIGYGDVMMSGSNPITTTLLGLWIASFNGMCLQLLTYVNMNEISIPTFSGTTSKKELNINNKYLNEQEEEKQEEEEEATDIDEIEIQAFKKLKIKRNTQLNKTSLQEVEI